MSACVSVCVCVCVKERERARTQAYASGKRVLLAISSVPAGLVIFGRMSAKDEGKLQSRNKSREGEY